jgi:murein DD-endopeptidase MepM/ murein hydrolase activator NlpD
VNGSVIDWLNQAGNAVLPFLLRQTLLSTLLFVIVLILVRIFRKGSPLFHLGLYALVLVRLVLPPDFSLPFSGRGILDASGLSGLFSIGGSAVSASHMETPDSGHSLGEEYGETGPFSGETRPFPWAAAVLSAWMTGVLVLSAVMCRRLIAFRRITRQADRPAECRILEAVERWRRLFGIGRPVRIVTSDQCLSPFTLGVRRPVIHIPRAALGKNDPELIESIIGHELAHVKTLDAFWIRIQNVLQVVYFFHPAVWVAVSRMHLLRECLCDDMVIARRRLSPESYGLGLLAVLKWNVFGAESMGLLPEFGSSRRKIMKRIENIKSARTSGIGKKGAAAAAAGTLLLGLLLLPMAGAGREGALKPSHTSSEPAAVALSAAETPKKTGGPKEEKEPAGFFSPLPGKPVLTNFGMMIDPWNGKEIKHKGVDIPARKGTPVLAAADGEVLRAENACTRNQGMGRNIVVGHGGGYKSVYTHLDSALVVAGQKVKRRDVIGKVGQTGRATGPHLHFEVWKGDSLIDPATVIDFGKGELKEVDEAGR